MMTAKLLKDLIGRNRLDAFSRLPNHLTRLFRTRTKASDRARNRLRLLAFFVEDLEARIALASPDYSQSIDLVFNVPKATAELGLHIGVYSNQSQSYLAPKADGSYAFTPYSQFASPNATALPLIDVAAPPEGGQVSLKVLLDNEFVSGEMIMFVGPVTGDELPFNSMNSTIATPKSATNPAVSMKPQTFAQFEFNFTALGNSPGLDIDISSVDSTGFPFAIVYPQSDVGYPLNPLGITLSQKKLHDNFEGFLMNQGEVGGVSVASLFVQCSEYVQLQDANSLQVIAPSDILSNGSISPTPGYATKQTPAVTKPNPKSNLAVGASYHYLVTAYSDNLIDGTSVYGETLPSTPIEAEPFETKSDIEISWTPYLDPNTAGYRIYRYASTDGLAPTDTTLYNLVGSIAGMKPVSGDYFTFTDTGLVPQAEQISVATASPYGFNPLSEYYTQALMDFFEHYEAPDSFVIHRDGVRWVGNTVEYAPADLWNQGGHTYRMLRLTARNASGTIEAGDVVSIYEPFFASNTRFVRPDAPPMPSWMINGGTSQYETPAEMVFGCDGVFASNKYDPDSVNAVGDIENSIASAFNRGIATQFFDPASQTGIVPDNWASFPQFVTQSTVDEVNRDNNYYYAITAVNVYGETTPSAITKAKPGSTLAWANGVNAAPAMSYNIYAGNDHTQLYLQASTTSNSAIAQAPKNQTTPLPYKFFSPDSVSNFYAAYVSSNSLNDPHKGVSINGLSYGFAYSDQGGVSTNIDFPIDSMPDQVMINLGVPSGPGFVTQMLPQATVNSHYLAAVVSSGTPPGTQATFTAGSGLPSWASLSVDGRISGTPTSAGSWSFPVTAAFGGFSNTLSYTLTAAAEKLATPLTVAGLVSDLLVTTPAEINLPSQTIVQASGGTGGPYWLQLDPTITPSLPDSLKFLPFDSAPISSQSGSFQLSGTPTSIQPQMGIGVILSDSTAAVAEATYGLTKAQFKLDPSMRGTGYSVNDQFPITGGGGKKAYIYVTAVDPVSRAITDWDVYPGSDFTHADDLAVGKSNSTGGTGAKFGIGDNPGVNFQSVIKILNQGNGYGTKPAFTLYGGGQSTNWTGFATLNNGSVVSLPGTSGLTASTVPLRLSIAPPKPAAQLAFTMDLTVNSALDINSTPLPAAAVAQPYRIQLSTISGVDASYSITSGTLPEGLYLTKWGLIAGTPKSVSAAEPFTVEARDSAGGVASRQFPGIAVNAATAALQIATTSLAATAPNQSYSQTLAVTGGVAPFIYSVASGSLPGGLILNPNTGTISGTVGSGESGGNRTFTVRVSDALRSESFASIAIGVLGISSPGLGNLPDLPANATTLTLHGFEFDPIAANNTVTLSSGTATVTSATATSMTLSIMGPLKQETLTVSLKNKVGQIVNVPVANVIASKTLSVTQSAGSLASFATLVIGGTGFSSTPGDNTVELSSGTAKVVEATSTALTIAFATLPGPGPLMATVTVQGVQAPATQVATIVANASYPTVNVSQATIISGQNRIEIYGTGFVDGATSVSLTDSNGTIYSSSVVVNSPTSLTLTSLDSNGFNFASDGYVYATATIYGVSSARKQVGNYSGDIPADIQVSSPVMIAENASALVINGVGFTPQSKVTLIPIYKTGNGQAFVPDQRFESSNRIVLTNLSIPMFNITGLPSGSNYSTAPIVTFSGGGPNAVQAQAVASINASKQVDAIIVTSPGSYSKEPIISFSGGQPAFTGNSAKGAGNGQGTITILSNAQAVYEYWNDNRSAAAISGPGIPQQAVITGFTQGADSDTGQLDFAYEVTPQNPLTPQTNATFSLGALPDVTVYFGQLQSIMASLNISDPANDATIVATSYSTGLTAPTVDGGKLDSNMPGGRLTIEGSGFHTDSAIDVQLFVGPDAGHLTPLQGFIETNVNGSGQQIVNVDSSTQLHFHLAGPLPHGNIWARVVSAGVPMAGGKDAAVLVATVLPPGLTTSTVNITPTPILVDISGSGFATKSGSVNAVKLWTGPDIDHLTPLDGTVVSVVAMSATGLEVTLDGAIPLPAGPLWATVSVDGFPLGTAQVATVASASQAPDISSSRAGLGVPAQTLSIAGSSFSTVANGNSVQLFTAAGKLGSPIVLTAASPTSILVPLPTGLISEGPLYAIVKTSSGSSGKEQVAMVNTGSVPTVETSHTRLAANASRFVIQGTGFSTTLADNQVTLSSGIAKVQAATATSLTITFSQPPLAGSPLVATVTSNGLRSAAVTVASVIAATTPTVTESTTLIPSSATTLVISGSGFDTNAWATNHVTLSSGKVTKTTINSPTQLTLTHDGNVAPGKLFATVTVNGVASANAQVANVGSTPVVTPSTVLIAANSGTLTILGTGFHPNRAKNHVTLSSGVAQVIEATSEVLVLKFATAPKAGPLSIVVMSDGISSAMSQVAVVYATITQSSATLQATARTLTIDGFGFDALNPANNIVALTSGTATVMNATPTRLTLSFTTPPLPGHLKATVVVGGVSNTAILPTQVASVVPGPISPAKSKLTVSDATAAVGMAVKVTLHACDANGNPLSHGGAIVAIRSSRPGSFTSLVDNGNGTYSAIFTSQRVGATSFQAIVNRIRVAQTATTSFFFESEFPGTQLTPPWSVRAGNFTPSSGTAFASSASLNIANYMGPVTANVNVSALVSNVATGQFAGLVARYTNRKAYYRAGILNEGGQNYAVIQAVGSTVRTLSKQAVMLFGPALLRFTADGSSLKLTLDGVSVGQAKNSRFKNGTVGIVSGPNAGFARFSVE